MSEERNQQNQQEGQSEQDQRGQPEQEQGQQDEQQDQGMADQLVDKLQERSSNQGSKFNQYVDTAQEKGWVQKAEEWVKQKLGRGGN